MKKAWPGLVFVVLLALTVPVYADSTAEEILKAVVKVRAIIPNEARTASTLGTEREGQGVLIDSEGHILTIGYLIVEAETIEVTGPEGKSIHASFVGYDHDTGFGLLRVDNTLGMAPIQLGQSTDLKTGDPILVAGHGGSDSVQAGRVISRREFAGYWEYLINDAIFTTPPYANFGGAALIGRDGRLLGIGSLFTQVVIQGLGSISSNMFVPIELLNPILSDLKTLGRSRKASRPWLGINSEEAHGRVFITRTTSDGPADRAGLQPGDLILAVGGKEVEGLGDFYRKIWATGDAGVEVSLSILRGMRIRELTVHSVDRYQFLLMKPRKVT
jgi:S1-C subfamily serine protease